MSDEYNPQEIEKKWQARWAEDDLYRAEVDPDQPKFYALTMLPYPSGNLHIGHWYAMAPSDARARWKRMQGYNVMFPMGFDAFGLPAENAAIKRRIHPKKWTYANIETMRRQLRSMGAMFDWEREAVSSDPSYYKWTEWFFIQFFKNGLAYKKMSPVDFCPHCNTTLAREQVWGEDRVCERCGTPVIKKDLDQWFFRITNYADELLDFSAIDWPERVVTMQKNWIGRSEGAQVIFTTERGDEMPVFTTRPDTLWGATFMVMAPEHPLVDELTTAEQRAEVDAYVEQAARASDIEREAADREKTGVFTGAYAINPVNGERIPIWVADYVLMTYGSGAIMAVPAHDQRDFEFARRFDLPIPGVIQPDRAGLMGYLNEQGMDADAVFDAARAADAVIEVGGEETIEIDWLNNYKGIAYAGQGVMVGSGPFDGTFVSGEKGRANPGISAVIDWLEEQGTGSEAVNYRLRDWLISRQRYWGAPIPMILCPTCGIVPVPEEDLPVLLPDDVEFMPTGESPLKLHPTWKDVTCPQCGNEHAERETDTMDTFMCSSWYHLRYLSPDYDDYPFDPEEASYWLPVDLYTGGIEHATMHLLYTRFFTKALRDCGVFDNVERMNPAIQPESTFDEPMTQLYNQGIILGEDREKMSKSRGNVIDPDDLVAEYGADVVRGYLMFAFKWDLGGPWDSQGILGVVRFLNDVWNLIVQPLPASQGEANEADVRALRRRTHQTILRVTDDIEDFSFNTAMAALMELKNAMQAARATPVAHTEAWSEAVRNLLLMMAPFTPHIAEELWERTGGGYSIHQQAWPEADPEIAAEEVITLIVQVNGKVRDRIEVPADIGEADAKQAALASERVQAYLDGGEPRKVIYVPGRLVNVVM
jgi:leucyl-tRNA synthetase